MRIILPRQAQLLHCFDSHCKCVVPDLDQAERSAPDPVLPCHAIGGIANTPGMDQWCSDTCSLGNCPPSLCFCEMPYEDAGSGGCARYKATGVLSGVTFADDYCHLACNAGNCPYICECDSSGSSPYRNCYASSELLRQPGMNAYCQVVCDNRWCPVECMCN